MILFIICYWREYINERQEKDKYDHDTLFAKELQLSFVSKNDDTICQLQKIIIRNLSIIE